MGPEHILPHTKGQIRPTCTSYRSQIYSI